ncbi:AfsR/SARP family transcriptional regulator [Fodinicola feengrottensis]|uniref:AfsR/SARP family transcriptional regulator n=1 Tax=Fodinicola feengrottensis TaxID=435914 RepID=UPI0031D549D4
MSCGGAVRFGVLGPALLETARGEVELRSRNQRTVLAVLLNAAGQPVQAARLMSALWPVRPPRTAPNAVHVAIHHLRKALEEPDRLRSTPAGYVLRTDPDEVDLERFQALVAAGRAALAAGSAVVAGDRLAAALGLWRGSAYEDLRDDVLLRTEIERLEELRLTALGARIDADLMAGRQLEVVGELRQLVRAHPTREAFAVQLMTALERTGRRGESVHVYHAARRALAREVGARPGVRLQAALRDVLATPAPALDRRPAPAQLPALPPIFVSRGAEIALRREVAAVVAISGPAGAGKTTLAVRIAHQLQDRFPDGQVYADLGGSLSRRVEPATILTDFLDSLGIEPIPAELQERTALYRSVLADRRVLVLLDGAVDESQVAPLLPGAGASQVLVTSRPRLTGLSAVDQLDLGPFTRSEGLELLAAVAGAERVRHQGAAAATVVDRCGGSAFALRIAGELLRDQPVADLAASLADDSLRLEVLSGVRASLSLSYQDLSASLRQALDDLGSLEATRLTVALAVSALGESPAAATEILEQLVDARLLYVVGRDNYQFYDLVRLYVREQCSRTCERASR